MNTTPATGQRVTCNVTGPRNPHDRRKLIATIVPDGLQVWCKYCRAVHLVPRAVCIAAWERGESAVSACETQEDS